MRSSARPQLMSLWLLHIFVEGSSAVPVEVLGAAIEPADYMRTLRELTSFVGEAHSLCLQQRPGDLLLQDESLSFYEFTSQ